MPDESDKFLLNLRSNRGRFAFGITRFVVTIGCACLFASDWIGADGWWRSWLSMAGFVLVASRANPIEAGAHGLVMGGVGLGASFWWAQDMLAYVMNVEGYLPRTVFAILIVWESLVFVAVGISIASLRQKYPDAVGLLIPICLWLVVEAYLPRVFRWSLGHSQLGAIPLAQTADIGGPSMVSLMVLSAACIPTLLLDWFLVKETPRGRAARRGLMVSVTVIAISLAYGLIRLRSLDWSSESKLRIGVVQEDPADNSGISRMSERSRRLASCDLLVWPESTLGIHATSLTSFRDAEQLLKLSKPPFVNAEPIIGMPSPLIVGGRSFDGMPNQASAEYQTAFLLKPDGSILDRYHKRSLMPLGEYVPGEKTMPWLHNWFQLGVYIENGTSAEPLLMPTGEKIGVIICYEDTMPEVTRQTVAAGSQLLVCIINDSAFESPVAIQQHLKLSRLRAIENRRSLVRCAGTGVSCVVDPVGNLHHELGAHEAGAFVADVSLLEVVTPYQLFGEWPPILAAAVVVCFLAREHVRSRSRIGIGLTASS